ncbi:hypothetical protein [Cystobacter ferrugineus]|uniref:Uncharacterized protein n=1 Tax=Cystobacter ferrugineus TaxID=83449 RepID=A0A1L9B568_9BACT|nr:hypothetical protein [Cystobacter ferrugineus]OJH37392.1 hypothetical protein BON30_29335 [Cystobacter ferrugineus]
MSKKNLLGLLMLVQLSGVLGCATVVRESTRGALDAIRQQKEEVDQEHEDSLTRGTAGQVTRGALDALITGEPPPKAQQIEENPGSVASGGGAAGGGGGGTPAPSGGAAASTGTGGSGLGSRGPVSVLSAQLARGLSAEFERQLGADGSGPLARSMSAAAGQVAASVIQQSKDEFGPIFPGCEGFQGEEARACREARMSQLSESIGGGLVRGMFKAAQPVLLIVAFGGGLLVGLLVFLALSVARIHRESGGGAGVSRQRRLV